LHGDRKNSGVGISLQPTQHQKTTILQIGDTFSNGSFSNVMLVFRGVPQKIHGFLELTTVGTQKRSLFLTWEIPEDELSGFTAM